MEVLQTLFSNLSDAAFAGFYFGKERSEGIAGRAASWGEMISR